MCISRNSEYTTYIHLPSSCSLLTALFTPGASVILVFEDFIDILNLLLSLSGRHQRNNCIRFICSVVQLLSKLKAQQNVRIGGEATEHLLVETVGN